MMSARPLLTDCTVADHSICAETTPRPSLVAMAATISASQPTSLPSSIATIGISPLLAIVSTPGVTVLNAGAAQARRPATAAPAATAAANRSRRFRCMINPLCEGRSARAAPGRLAWLVQQDSCQARVSGAPQTLGHGHGPKRRGCYQGKKNFGTSRPNHPVLRQQFLTCEATKQVDLPTKEILYGCRCRNRLKLAVMLSPGTIAPERFEAAIEE